MYSAPPCVYKRGDSTFFIFFSLALSLHARTRPLPGARYWHLPQSSSRDLGASLPLSPRLYPLLQAPPVQDSTVHSHTPLLDVRPRGRNQDKTVRYCDCLLHHHLGRGNMQHLLVGIRAPGSGHRQLVRQLGEDRSGRALHPLGSVGSAEEHWARGVLFL